MSDDSLTLNFIVGLTVKIYALLTPPVVLSAFIQYNREMTRREKIGVALKTAAAIFVLGECLLLFGSRVFGAFDFTLDAFRVGVGILLFLSAARMMNDDGKKVLYHKGDDISVVPLAVPLSMGPSTIGAVIVLGASAIRPLDLVIDSICLLLASLGMAILLCLCDPAERILGKTGITVMSKLTALIISAVAAQVIFTGAKGFLTYRATGVF